MTSFNWGDKIYFRKKIWRIVEVDEGKKHYCLADRDGGTAWFPKNEVEAQGKTTLLPKETEV